MHFEFLVEDISGAKMLEKLIPKILCGDNDSYKIHQYRGCGSLPPKSKSNQPPEKRALLNQLPRILNGYGNQYQNNYNDNVVIVVCDLDDRDKASFLSELNTVSESCHNQPQVRFCLAIEEGEAWLLGDWNAIKKAYPKAKEKVFSKYQNDSICGTWEKLADIVYAGGSSKLKKQGYAVVGQTKCEWAELITPWMDVSNNKSPSFNYFKSALEDLCDYKG